MPTFDRRQVAAIALAVGALAPAAVSGQDVPGIEICTAEKTMERRTSCLQSNVNFLQQSLTRQSLAAQQKLDASNRQIETLKDVVAQLRRDIDQLKSAAKPTQDPVKDTKK